MSKTRIVVTGGSGFIGIHLVEALIDSGYQVLNLDIQSPIDGENTDFWKNTSLLDNQGLKTSIANFDPQYIVHLGATTTQDAHSILDFEVNVQGTKNLLEIAKDLGSLRKFVFTSTQYVNTPGNPHSDQLGQLRPYGFYGESKLIGEVMTLDILHRGNWTIIRPTTIWGPWHAILTNGLWKQIVQNTYFHLIGDEAIKSYGYVKNTVWQIIRLLEIEPSLTDRKVFYLGDENMRQDLWVSAFVNRLTGRKMRKVPKFILFCLSEAGELFIRFGVKSPLYRSRYRNLVTSNPSPLKATLELVGPSPISFPVAILETCSWLEKYFTQRKKVD